MEKNRHNYKTFYRLKVPFTETSLTPAERELSQDEGPYIARLRNVLNLLELGWEEFTYEEEMNMENWPWPHTGTYRDIVGNAKYGDRSVLLPNIYTGLPRLMTYQSDLPLYERLCVCAAHFDIPFKRIWEFFLDYRPLGLKEEKSLYLERMRENKALPVFVKDEFGREFVGMKGELLRVKDVNEYLEYWFEQRLERARVLLQLALEQDTTDERRRGFIHKLLYRVPLVGKTTTYFDLSLEEKREYAGELGKITVEEIGRESLVRKIPTLYDIACQDDE